MIDNITLLFNDKKVVEDWCLANKYKFSVTQKRSLDERISNNYLSHSIEKRKFGIKNN